MAMEYHIYTFDKQTEKFKYETKLAVSINTPIDIVKDKIKNGALSIETKGCNIVGIPNTESTDYRNDKFAIPFMCHCPD